MEIEIVERYADNGELSHKALINKETGDLLWSEAPEEGLCDITLVIGCARDDLGRIRQWFECAQDLCHNDYLEPEDYELAKKVYTQLEMRVPNSVGKHCR